MRKTLVPVLLLATVALSTSNFIPILSMNEFKSEPLGSDGQQDNTFSNKYQSRSNLNDVLLDFGNQVESEENKLSQPDYLDTDRSVSDESYNTGWKKDNYNVKGFRKEQWHNYPRQLDRLNRQFYENRNTDKRNLDPDDPGNDYIDDAVTEIAVIENDGRVKELQEPETLRTVDEVETAAAMMNPLIILKIHLDCLKKDKNYNQYPFKASDKIDYSKEIYEDGNLESEVEPTLNINKVKREEKEKIDDLTQLSSKQPTVEKRIFSLWSRLQSLNQKGHELHHRRHLYALYGLPDSEGGAGVLTAETRATFMRPPGSPLRWG